MRLAENNDLSVQEVHLLANCSQPVFVLEISSVAEGLILRDLVRSFPAVCQHSKRHCYLLAATDKGRRYVEEWIERHVSDASESVVGRVSTDRVRSTLAW